VRIFTALFLIKTDYVTTLFDPNLLDFEQGWILCIMAGPHPRVSRMVVCILLVLIQPQPIWMHVYQSYAKHSVKPLRSWAKQESRSKALKGEGVRQCFGNLHG